MPGRCDKKGLIDVQRMSGLAVNSSPLLRYSTRGDDLALPLFPLAVPLAACLCFGLLGGVVWRCGASYWVLRGLGFKVFWHWHALVERDKYALHH